MTAPIKLLPCPFCEGPPSPICTRYLAPHGVFPDSELEGDDGLQVEAYVFCHECGAQGAALDDIAFSVDECEKLTVRACELWNSRGTQHRVLYDHCEQDGLNLYPRAGAI